MSRRPPVPAITVLALAILAGAAGCVVPDRQIASAPAPIRLAPPRAPAAIPAPPSPPAPPAAVAPPPPSPTTPEPAPAIAPPEPTPPPAQALPLAPDPAPPATNPMAVSVFYGRGRAVGICEVALAADAAATVRSVTPLDRETFLRYLRQHLAASTPGEAAVFLHGPDVSFDEACRRTGQRRAAGGFRGVPTMFSAPVPATRDGGEAAREAWLQEFVELVLGCGPDVYSSACRGEIPSARPSVSARSR